MFYFDKINDNKVLKSDYLEEITAFFTTRTTNEDEVFCKLGAERILRPEQTHSSNVEIVDGRDEYKNTDGLILTNNKDLVCLKFADCTPLIFYDKKLNIAAVTHAGWRGTAQKIGPRTVEIMKNEFQCDVNNITVLVGPAISLCCYEVSDEVRDELLNTVSDKIGLYNGNNVDLKGINASQLEEIGVKNIDICPYCTSCNNDLFYSYRKENGTPLRHKAVIKL